MVDKYLVNNDKIAFVGMTADIPLPTHKFFIKITPKKLFIQYNSRIINWICKNKEEALSKINHYKLLPFRTLHEIEEQYKKDLDEYVIKLKYKLCNKTKIINFLEKQIF